MLLPASRAPAAPRFDTSAPASFFNNVANQVLLTETAAWQAQNFPAFTNSFGVTNAFGLTNLPVYVNGSFVYASSVQRLLQVTANLLDATTTSPYPSVFRPTFYQDPNSGNIFINGYQAVTNVTGPADPQLSTPVDISALASGIIPPTNIGGAPALNNINVYGVPWIIGAKKGLPSFNELNMLNTVQVARLLQVSRFSTNSFIPSNYTTNQMFVMSISNSVGMSLWNSYNADYTGSGNISIFMQDTMRVGLTNANNSGSILTNFVYYVPNIPVWPGSAWAFGPPGQEQAASQSFFSTNWTLPFLTPSVYQYPSGLFVPFTDPATQFQTNVTFNYPFPQFALMTTNWAQAFVLDGNHVVDYVQLSGPSRTRNLTAELQDPNYPDGTGIHYMWSTNTYPTSTSGGPSYGEVNQILLSRGAGGVTVPPGGTWVTTPTAPGAGSSPAAQQAYFGGFFTPTWTFNGIKYGSTEYSIIAPFTPTRTMYDYTLWQVNDPLVHYLASDLFSFAINANSIQKSDTVPAILNVVGLNLSQVGSRFQPWGMSQQLAGFVGVDTNAYNPAFKDPLVLGPDSWNFPTNQTLNPNWLGQVHRGTPWQTIYLKAPDIMRQTNNFNGANVGTNTWAVWTGNGNFMEAQRTSPVNDWHLASLLTALLNTNASPALFSVNSSDPNAWAVQFDGLSAVTNLSPGTSILLSSNSPAVAGIVAAIQSARTTEPGQVFQDVGDILAVPQLSTQSPFLNWSDPVQRQSGITDAAYEQLPSQLLSELGLASQGSLAIASGQLLVQFSGAAGHVYALQSSADLVHWTSLSTNSPVNGQLSFSLPATPTAAAQFYRTLLLQ